MSELGIEELVHLLLQRMGITAYEPMNEAEMSEEDWAARMGGCEGYCPSHNSYLYVVFPEDVQDLLRELSFCLYEHSEIDFEYYGEEE